MHFVDKNRANCRVVSKKGYPAWGYGFTVWSRGTECIVQWIRSDAAYTTTTVELIKDLEFEKGLSFKGTQKGWEVIDA